MATAEVHMQQPEKELETKALTWKERALTIVVCDQASYEMACEELKAVKDLRAEAERHHRPMIDAAHKAHKATLDALKRVDEPLAEAERILKGGIGLYDAEQRRIAADTERRAREEEERRRAEELEAQIEEAEASGASIEEVAAIASAPMVARAVTVAPTIQPVKGVSTARSYRARVTDARALCRHVADTGHVNLVTANMTALNQMARAMKTTMNIPGVVVEEDTVVRAGGR